LISLASDELIVVGFAGGGGSCTGIEQALGRPVDIAINHDPEAIAMHRANHPQTKHYCQNIWQVRPHEAIGKRKVGLAWFSPDCKHFSKAKGGKPVEKNIRDLAWVVVTWIKDLPPAQRPRVIMLENVEEFRDWGPLLESGRPCPDRKGSEFRKFVRELRRYGYKDEWAERRASLDGTPTLRKRLYGIIRNDGEPIIWPRATHGPAFIPYRTAAECIDWSIPCPSIFLSREEGRALGVNRPLAEATMRRIGRGVWRYVINSAKPFIVPITHTTSGDRVHSIDEPLRTVTTASRGEHALVAPYLVPRYSERPPANGKPGQEPRVRSVEEPFPTIVPTGNDGMLAAVHLAKFRGDSAGHPVDEPLSTITANSYVKRPGGAPPQAVVATFLAKHYGGHESPGAPMDAPLSTITTQDHHHLVAAHLTKFQENSIGTSTEEPLHTVMAGAPRHSIVTSHLVKLRGTSKDGQPVDQPMHTITAGGWHIGEVRAFLLKYYDTAVGQSPAEPLHTATTKARFGLVTVAGVDYQIVDIGMRMLKRRELFRAQGFPDSYIIDRGLFLEDDGTPVWRPLTNSSSIRMCGNSVCPPVARALVAANLGAGGERAAA
jgi:DNA (cytosine-5)-methyltransferase 1